MAIKFFKKLLLHSGSNGTKTQKIVQDILSDVKTGNEENVIDCAAK